MSSEEFIPNMRVLLRVLAHLLDGPTTLTKIRAKTKLNHTKYKAYVEWLEDRGIIESVIEKHKARMCLTKEGREVALVLLGYKRKTNTK